MTHGGLYRRFAGPIPAHPAAVGREIYGQDRPLVALLLVRRMYSSGGRNRLPQLKPDRPKNGLKRSIRGFWVLGIFSLVLGLDPNLAPKTRLI